MTTTRTLAHGALFHTRHFRACILAEWPRDWRHRVGSAIGMAAHHQARLRQEQLIGVFQLVIVVVGLVIDDFADTSLHGLLEAVEAGACGYKEAGILGRGALSRRQRDGVLLAMHTEAILQPG